MEEKNPVIQFIISFLGGGFLGVAIASAVTFGLLTIWVLALAVDEVAGTNLTRGITSLQRKVDEFKAKRKTTNSEQSDNSDGSAKRNEVRGIQESSCDEGPVNLFSEKRLHGAIPPNSSAEL